MLTLALGVVAVPSVEAQQLISVLPSGQSVGTTVHRSVEPDTPGFDFRLSASKLGSPSRVIYDFSEKSLWEWTPLEDGFYRVEASVRDIGTGVVTSLVKGFKMNARVTDTPIITPTDHPLVALYSAPPC